MTSECSMEVPSLKICDEKFWVVCAASKEFICLSLRTVISIHKNKFRIASMCWCGLMSNNSVSQAGPPSKQRVLSLQGSNGWSQDFVGGCIHHWLVRTSLFLSVTVVIPSSFTASSPVQQSTHNTGNEKEAHLLYSAWLRKHSRRLSSSYVCQLSERNELLKMYPKQI